MAVRSVRARLREDELAQLAALAEHFGWTFNQTIRAALDRLADDVRQAAR